MFWFSTKPISNQTWLLPAHVNQGNFCFWNPQSWALESGIQLKESGIQNPQRTIKNPRIQDFLGAVADPGEGPRLPPPPPHTLIFRQNWGPKSRKNFLGRSPPPYQARPPGIKLCLITPPPLPGYPGFNMCSARWNVALTWAVSRNRERVAQPFPDFARATRLEIKPRNTFLYALRISLFVL